MALSRGADLRGACHLGAQVAAKVISTSESACPEGCDKLFDD